MPGGQAPNRGPEDLLELMLRAARENDPNRIDELNIRHQVVTFLVAGHETTSGALSFALYYLSRNPDVLAKAQAEVDKVWEGEEPAFEKIGGNFDTYDASSTNHCVCGRRLLPTAARRSKTRRSSASIR